MCEYLTYNNIAWFITVVFRREDRQEHAGTDDDAAQQTVGRRTGSAATEENEKEEDLPAVLDVRGLQGCRVQRLDSSAAGLRRVLLPRGVHVPVGQSHQRVQPRGHADFDELVQSGGGPAGVLRADKAQFADAALRGRRRQVGGEELPGNDRGRMRMQMRRNLNASREICRCLLNKS